MRRRNRDRLVIIQKFTKTTDPDDGTPVQNWVTHATVYAEVMDLLPSRAENIDDSISIASRPCRVRMLFRDDVNSKMRFKLPSRSPGEADRYLRIVSGPAEINGWRERIEWVAEELSTAGQEP